MQGFSNVAVVPVLGAPRSRVRFKGPSKLYRITRTGLGAENYTARVRLPHYGSGNQMASSLHELDVTESH